MLSRSAALLNSLCKTRTRSVLTSGEAGLFSRLFAADGRAFEDLVLLLFVEKKRSYLFLFLVLRRKVRFNSTIFQLVKIVKIYFTNADKCDKIQFVKPPWRNRQTQGT